MLWYYEIGLLSSKWSSGPQPFWHQGSILWKIIFPQTEVCGKWFWDDSRVLYLLCFLFLLFFIIFNWRMIALQYWFDFCHTLTWITHRCTYVSPPWEFFVFYSIFFNYLCTYVAVENSFNCRCATELIRE